MSWTPLTNGTPGTMIIAGATRHNAGVALTPNSTAAPPMTPLTSAAAKGMKKGLNPRRPNSWRSHIPAEPASQLTPNVGQSQLNNRPKLAAVNPNATTTIHRLYTDGLLSISS